LEYFPAILAPSLSNHNLNNLQIIQNNALRICLKKPRDTPIIELHQQARITKIQDRLFELAVKYLVKGVVNFNPIIIETIRDYIRFSGGRELNKPTLLDPYKSELVELLKENDDFINQLEGNERTQFIQSMQT
jgi:hypothetical protein